MTCFNTVLSVASFALAAAQLPFAGFENNVWAKNVDDQSANITEG